MTIPNDSPVTRALAATQKAVEHEQRVLKNLSRSRMAVAQDAINGVGDLVVYNPTVDQCAAMVAQLETFVAAVREQFKTVVPRQVEMDL